MSNPRKEGDAEVERERRLAEAFQDVLPEGTRDEDSEGWGDRTKPEGSSRDEEWLHRQMPPHHG